MPFPSYNSHLTLPITIISIILLQYYFSTSSIATTRTIFSNENGGIKPNKKDFIKISCSNTIYPKLCYTTLSNYSNKIINNPKDLASAALNATLSEAKSAKAMVVGMSNSRQRVVAGKASAVRDCMETLSDSLDELRMSVEEMDRANPNGSNFRMLMNNIQTWVSAALTDDDTCMDGFNDQLGDKYVNQSLRDEIVKVAHLTSNALALINNYASSF